jgi:hypothetical protein
MAKTSSDIIGLIQFFDGNQLQLREEILIKQERSKAVMRPEAEGRGRWREELPHAVLAPPRFAAPSSSQGVALPILVLVGTGGTAGSTSPNSTGIHDA